MERKVFEIIANALADKGYTIVAGDEYLFRICSPDGELCYEITITGWD